ncbi:RelA/SpoT domain-containing protein [Castellaniella defragrans]|uniref:PpGpp synthetase/RelA/SpoT-type nucleotidyltransferase n=1 Tax=Castellaniella defragrans TaxID=75697 RepID=A0A7W9WLJ9_CASDE|nr:RelA/SpoT domain-containing protein [Castellaniella defragrans]KAB0604052.1 RelA/SpoT domain-containing protein [Castellaniella defragrans]MBB6083347.1 ppGpp synthetase/RelA/SpoT-type nucleotidyltransferase [Castellaniella defragrans]
MKLTKTRIDRVGIALSKGEFRSEEELLELEGIFDEYRKSHLQPLSETTIELQHWLNLYGDSYYIAQRLKRKPQIVRKLNRLSVRLTQLQDIGGCRIIVEKNQDVDRLRKYIEEKISNQSNFNLIRTTDYREKGRDDTGYRSLHLIFEKNGIKLELQIRSRIQHYWAESIERTSVIYGYHLKEKEGDQAVIDYFKKLSDIFYEIEAGREPHAREKLELDQLRIRSEGIIESSDKNKIFDSYINEDIIKTLAQKEARNKHGLNNWIIVFDWNTGAFVSWDIINRDPDDAISAYVEYEKMFPASEGYEVVMIGSSDVATVRQTHSHYFGIESYDSILENLDQSIIGFSKRIDIDIGARQILIALHRKRHWGNNRVPANILKNHHCGNMMTFESSLRVLQEKELVTSKSPNDQLSLNIKKKAEIEQYI